MCTERARRIIALIIVIRAQRTKTPVDVAEMERRTGWPRPVCCRFVNENMVVRQSEVGAEISRVKELRGGDVIQKREARKRTRQEKAQNALVDVVLGELLAA